MTDYPNRKAAWKKQDVKRKGRELLAVFIVIVLFFAITNGLIKTFSFKNYLGKSTWDGKSSMTAVIGATHPAIFVFQPEPKRIAIFKLDPEIYYLSGKSDNPLVKLSSFDNTSNIQEITKIISISTGIDIENYIVFNNYELQKESIGKAFKNFASVATPFKILFGKKLGIASTNVTQRDLLKLWWQAKDISVNKVEIADLGAFSQEVVSSKTSKVLGVDSESLHFKISPYLINQSIVEGNVKVQIENAQDSQQALNLAEQFLESSGFTVAGLESGSPSDTTKIVTFDRDSYASFYLAKIFDCDIVGAPRPDRGQAQENNVIKVILGSDFTNKYFK